MSIWYVSIMKKRFLLEQCFGENVDTHKHEYIHTNNFLHDMPKGINEIYVVGGGGIKLGLPHTQGVSGLFLMENLSLFSHQGCHFRK